MPERISDQVWKHFRWGEYITALDHYQENCDTICRHRESCPIKRDRRSISECMATRLAYLSMLSRNDNLDEDINKFNEWRKTEFPPL